MSLRLQHRRIPSDEPGATNPPLVVLHGLFGSQSNFRTVGQRLAAQRDVVLVDLRNHGASPWNSDVSLPAMAADIAGLVEELNVPAVVLCGHSLGGKVAMLTALQYPNRISRLCVVDIAPIVHAMEGNRSVLETLLALPEDVLGDRSAADKALQSRANESNQFHNTFVRQFILQNLLPTQRAWRLNARALLENYPKLQDFPATSGAFAEIPTLFIGGERGGMLSRKHQGKCMQYFPNSRLEMLPTGHYPHAEAPDRFAEIVTAFCQE